MGEEGGLKKSPALEPMLAAYSPVSRLQLFEPRCKKV